MKLLESIKFNDISIEKIKHWEHRLCLVVSETEKSSSFILELDKVMEGTLLKYLSNEKFKKLSNGQGGSINFPRGLKADELQIVKVKKNKPHECVIAGTSVANLKPIGRFLLLIASKKYSADIIYGFFLKSYKFERYKSKKTEVLKEVLVMNLEPNLLQKKYKFFQSLLYGVYFCRDLINEPANILNTVEFSSRLKSLEFHGLKVEILEEQRLKELGMRALLAVGQGSCNPSKVAIIRWEGSKKKKKPILLVGKGVVFDSGGISIKSAGGMEEMVMDMGGAAVVAGVMKSLALRQAKVNAIGLVGLVENMPDGKSQRPGDVVKTLKGDTVEVINTDAEGRLLLSDLLWFGQQEFAPKVIIDLATLTGAIIVALGYQYAGVFSNNNSLCEKFLTSAKVVGEKAWRLPLHTNFKKHLKSRVADLSNVGGRAGSAIIAAQFLENFLADDMPWIHIDIAGVAFSKTGSEFSPQGATGWGVASLNHLIYSYYEDNVKLS